MWIRSVVSYSLWPHELQPKRFLHPWNFPGKSIGVGCHFLLQRIFPTQRSNLGLTHCGQTLNRLSHQGSILKFKVRGKRNILQRSVRGRKGFLCGSKGKESACNAGDLSSIPGLGRSPGEENGYTLQYSCLGNPMDRGAWWATAHGVAKSRTRLKWLTHTKGKKQLFYYVNIYFIHIQNV